MTGDCDIDEVSSAVAFGTLLTESNKPIQNAIVTINSDASSEYPLTTFSDEDGMYAFESNPIGEEFNLTADKKGDWLNGVSTVDRFLIKQHILAKAELESSYKIIAADVNNDAQVSAADIVDARNMILGLTNEFIGNYSWKFVDSKLQFIDESNPWPFVSEVNIPYLFNGENRFDFVGIKIGDVNDNVVPNDNDSAELRNNLVSTIELEEMEFRKNQIIEVELDFSSLELFGFQFTLGLQDLKLLDVKITEGNNAANFGYASIEDKVTMSYFSDQDFSDQLLVTLFFTTSANGRLSDSLNINSSITKNEVYNRVTGNTSTLGFIYNSIHDGIELYQNTPNPFTDETELSFYIPSAGQTVLRIVDVTGKEIYRHESFFEQGEHKLKVNKEQLKQGSGVMYYQLELNGSQQSKVNKMIQLN